MCLLCAFVFYCWSTHTIYKSLLFSQEFLNVLKNKDWFDISQMEKSKALVQLLCDWLISIVQGFRATLNKIQLLNQSYKIRIYVFKYRNRYLKELTPQIS